VAGRTSNERPVISTNGAGDGHQEGSPSDAKRDVAAVADVRDRAAGARDVAAEARDLAMAQLDAAAHDDSHPLTESDAIVRTQSRQRRTAQRRAQAAEQRELAAQDRRRAAQDREQAARERDAVRAEREAMVDERRVQQARIEQAVRHQRRAEQLARTLQKSLSPPSLPHIAGIDVAVHYEPSAPEDVGGDFYDLFPLAGGRSGFFLGDVCGKGPEAAAVTSLARYTMRTAAILHESPDAILVDLNVALLMQGAEPIQTCTAVYGEINMSGDDVTITLAVAGHPPPMLVRAHGDVETTTARGTMLGVIAHPAFETCQITLGPGDAIVICSDGIYDTEINGTRVDEQHVADLLAGIPQASAQTIVERLTHALHATDRPLRDDFAVMALQRNAVAIGAA